MSENNAVTAEAELTELHGIGSARSEYIPRETVGELARSSAQQVFNDMDDEMSGGEVEEVVNKAREALDDDDLPSDATVYTKDSSDDDDDESTAEVVEESFGDDVDSFVESGGGIGDGLVPSDCETIAIMAGDGVFDPNGKHSDMDPEDMAKLVAHRLIEFDFDNVEKVIALGSGMGRTAVNAWASYTKHETDQELPELAQISVQTDAGYPSGDDYAERDQRVLEAVDGICVVANGDFVGKYVNMVRDRPDDDVIIRTPDLDDE